MQALDNVTILDLTHHIAGPYATRLFADYGADVIKVERPAGDIARTLGPFKGGTPDPERSGLFFFLNTNKRSVVLDFRTAVARKALAELARRADLVIESFAPGTLERFGLGWDFFHAIKPDLPLVSVSNFGQTGPYRDYKGSELTLYAYAGEMYSMGVGEREPVKMAGTAGLFESGASVAAAAMGALFGARRHGTGQHVDISIAETHAGGVDRRHATFIAYQYSGRKTLRAASGGGGTPAGIYPCADGYVDFTAAAVRYDRVLDMIGEADWLADPRFSDPVKRADPAVIEDWNAGFLMWCLERTKREIWAEARRAKVLCGPLFTVRDMFEDDHFRNRGFWAHPKHAALGEVEIPGRPFIMERGGWELRRPAPLLGEHSTEVLSSVGLSPAEIKEAAGAPR